MKTCLSFTKRLAIAHREYMQEHNVKISFAKFLRLLGYTKKDRDLLLMCRQWEN